jgi:hypothetical protein
MTRPLTLLTALALVAAPATAVATQNHGKPHHKAKVLRAKLKPTTPEIKAYTAYTGKAQMVVNKRNAKISIHLKHMVAGATYPWAVVTKSCAGTAVTGLKYKTLKARKSGVANAKGSAKKKGFAYDKAATYFVVVRAPGTTSGALLCGELKAVKKGSSAKAKGKHKTSKGKSNGKRGK